jgi:hopanoid C-2 methylase
VATPFRKPRALVVLAHFDDARNPEGRPRFIPQGVGHAVLAGAFDPGHVDVVLYSEFHSGPLLDEALLSWPDMLVLTGVTSAFDRMRQLAAYARTKSPGCVVVAGGPAVRNLPLASANVFDYACQGDVEELMDVVTAVFGPAAAAAIMTPRFDLLTWVSPVNYAETSRYCNFRCSFCSLTAEKREYANYDLDFIERQIRGYREKKIVLFIDNNFFGNNRLAFGRKLDLLQGLYKEGIMPGWIALVTSDFFAHPGNVTRVKRAGCLGLFCGVESFSPAQIESYNKKQNLLTGQVEMIRTCLEEGIVFQYGLIFDPAAQSRNEMEEELDFVLRCGDIPLPAFLSLTIPLLGTPHFEETAKVDGFLPLAKLRDMDGFTLMTRPRENLEAVLPFVRQLAKLDGRARAIARHGVGFWWRYRRTLSGYQMGTLLLNSARLCLPGLINGRRTRVQGQDERLTYVTTTQPLGPLYRPAFRVPERLAGHFLPTMITDTNGRLEPAIGENLAARDPVRAAPRAGRKPRVL